MTTTQHAPGASAPPMPPRRPMGRPTRRVLVIIGSILALLVVLALAVLTTGRLLQSTERTTHVLPPDLTSLIVDSGVGDVEVRAVGPGEEPGAVATVRSGLLDPEVTVVTSGGTATLTDTCSGWWFENCSLHWEVLVPSDAAVTVVSGVGDVTATDLAGPLSLTSSVGDVTGLGVRSDEVTVRSSVGDVDLELVTAPDRVQVRSSTGDVSLSVPVDGVTYRMVTDASVGMVRNSVGSDSASPRTIDLRTAVGDITVRPAG